MDSDDDVIVISDEESDKEQPDRKKIKPGIARQGPSTSSTLSASLNQLKISTPSLESKMVANAVRICKELYVDNQLSKSYILNKTPSPPEQPPSSFISFLTPTSSPVKDELSSPKPNHEEVEKKEEEEVLVIIPSTSNDKKTENWYDQPSTSKTQLIPPSYKPEGKETVPDKPSTSKTQIQPPIPSTSNLLTEEEMYQIEFNRRKAKRILQEKRHQRKMKEFQQEKLTTRFGPRRKKFLEETDSDVELPNPNPIKPDEIPAVTALLNTKNDPRQKSSDSKNQKLLKMSIADLCAATIKYEKPLIFEHKNIEFKYVNIVGKIMGFYTNVTTKVHLIVDDTTGRVTCIYEPKPTGVRPTILKKLKKATKKMAQPERLMEMKKTFAEILPLKEEEFIEKVEENPKLGDDFLDMFSYVLLRQTKQTNIDDYPLKEELFDRDKTLGRYVSITGKTFNFPEERIIFIWDIKYISVDEFFVILGELCTDNI